MATGQAITLRLTINNPVPGVAYSLQNKRSEPIGVADAEDGPLSFDVPLRIAPGPRFLGKFVRSEWPTRRFVYIAIGTQAGVIESCWNRRAKIDVHSLASELIAQALEGKVLEAILPGRDKNGGPACATLPPIGGWRVVELARSGSRN